MLWRPHSIDDVAERHGVDPGELADIVGDARIVLAEHREARVRPATDDKVLAGWNAMAISGLAEAGRAFGEPAFVRAAERCAVFVLEHLRDDTGRLLRSWRNGVPGRPGFADDHALMSSACLTLYETTLDLRWFHAARELAGRLIELFLDRSNGGFHQTGSDAEKLVVRPKDLYDNATPSGNSQAAEVLQRLALLTGDTDMEAAGVSAIRLVRDAMAHAPTGFGQALCALDLYVGPSHEVALIGDPDDPTLRAMADEVRSTLYRPNTVLAAAAEGDADATGAIALLQDRPAVDGLPTAYVCQRFTCRLPVTDLESLREQLG